ncbi:HXXEE domain-containing protein [Streptococcus pantholopis]|uniref:HXXEE domain-containing protein n=1 Tax=Streptococcus pantholopis TaxID=1811193 RepID=A0A172Q8J9_9STRE|nr:HXXEE domain-containing protein [Streptococcus pantholopis]AND79780.1 hypothetical protein A0O21_06940 [Streptococcus pantholopis]
MTSALLAFLAIVLFMIHEFEEIVRVRPWIDKKGSDPRLASEMFISGRASYPSAETVAALIMEEFILAGLVLFAGIIFRLPELVLAITLGHTLHLFVHIGQALSFRIWVPGSITSVLTMPVLLLSIAVFILSQSLNWLLLFILVPLIFAALLLNLNFLHSQSAKVEQLLHG